MVVQVQLPSQNGVAGFSTGRTDDIARLSVDNSPATLEPASVAFSKDSRYAYVTLQENSGVVRLEICSGELTFFRPWSDYPPGRPHRGAAATCRLSL